MHRRSTVLASLALMATTALAGTPGQAIVVNQCSYPVYVHNTPSADGVHTDDDKTLQTGNTYTQTWTQLANKDGWSIKLSKVSDISNADILQYEYTWNNDGTIWFDLSAVNGNPWAGNWQVSSTSPGCNPRQTWYRFDTDDAFGMQDCVDSSSVTVTLCPSSGSVQSVVSSIVAAIPSAVVAPTPSTTTTPAPASTTPTTTAHAEPSTTEATHTEPAHSEPAHTEPAHTEAASAASHSAHALGFEDNHFVNAAFVAKTSDTPATTATPTTTAAPTTTAPVTTAVPTTFTTAKAVQLVDDDLNVVTEVVTVVETATAYETYVPGKRHVHHPNHPHFR